MNTQDETSALLYNSTSQYCQGFMRKNYTPELEMDSNDIVIDIGCGTGNFCKEIASKVKFVIGFDHSAAMIEAANNCNPMKNIEYHVADAHSFVDHLQDWKHTTFDKAFCFFVLNWCRDQKKVLENIYSCLKPGGTVQMLFALESRILSLKCSLGETTDSWIRRHPKWGPYVKNYIHYQNDWENKEDFIRLVRSVGFVISEAKVEKPRIPALETGFLKDVIRTLIGHMAEIPDELKDEFVDDVDEWFIDSARESDASTTGILDGLLINLIAQRKEHNM